MAHIVHFLESVKVFEGLEHWHTVISSNLSRLESHFKFVACLVLPLDISQIVSKAIWSLKIKASLVATTGGMNFLLLFLHLVRTLLTLSFITVEIERFLLSPSFLTCIVLEAKKLVWYIFWVLDPHFSGTPIYYLQNKIMTKIVMTLSKIWCHKDRHKAQFKQHLGFST